MLSHKIISKGIIFTILSVTFLTSCVHVTDLTGIKEVSYKNDVSAVLSANCNYSGCHGGNGEQFSLTTYDAVISNGGIKANDARGSQLYRSITRRWFVQQMPPKGSTQLSDDDIRIIYVWIQQGAKNN